MQAHDREAIRIAATFGVGMRAPTHSGWNRRAVALGTPDLSGLSGYAGFIRLPAYAGTYRAAALRRRSGELKSANPGAD